jgi:hypothetical protein
MPIKQWIKLILIDKHYHTMLYRIPNKTIDLLHVTDTLYYIILHRVAGENHWQT